MGADASFPPVGGAAGGGFLNPTEEDRRNVYLENRAAAERNRGRAEAALLGPAAAAAGAAGVAGVESVAGAGAAAAAAADEEERRKVFWENRAAVERNRARALDEVNAEGGGVAGGGVAMFIDPVGRCRLTLSNPH